MPPRKILLNRQPSSTDTQSARNASKISNSASLVKHEVSRGYVSKETSRDEAESKKVSHPSRPLHSEAKLQVTRSSETESPKDVRTSRSVKSRVERETSRISVDDALNLLPREVKKIQPVAIIEDDALKIKSRVMKSRNSESRFRETRSPETKLQGSLIPETKLQGSLIPETKLQGSSSPETKIPEVGISKNFTSKEGISRNSTAEVKNLSVISRTSRVEPSKRKFTSESPILVRNRDEDIKIIDRSYNSRKITASPNFDDEKRTIVSREVSRESRPQPKIQESRVSISSSRSSRGDFDEERRKFEEEKQEFLEQKRKEDERRKNLKENVKIEMRIKQIEKQFGIVIPEDPEQRYEIYQVVILELKKRSFRKNGRRLLLFVSVAIEFALVDLLGIACSGFATDQLNQVREYDDIIDDLGDKWFFSNGAGMAPEVRLGLLFGFNLFLFVMSNYALRAGIPGVETGKTIVRDLVTKTFLVDDPPVEEVPDDHAATLQFGAYRILRATRDAAVPQPKEQAGPSRPKGPIYTD